MTELIDRHLAATRAAGLTPKTRAAREELLRRLDRELPRGIEEANEEELTEWLGRDGWATKTRETYWCHLVAFYRWASSGRSPVLDFDPSADMPRPRVGWHLPRVATDAQLAHALTTLARPALRAVILAAGLGMRASEVADAEREHITQERARILGKGDKGRAVPVPPDVWAEVADCAPGRLVTNYQGFPVNGSWVTNYLSRALTAIGEPRLTLHYFRGAYATRLRRAGVDTAVIARLLGHTSVATTQRYLDIGEADLALAVAKLPPLPLQLEPGTSRLEPTAEAA